MAWRWPRRDSTFSTWVRWPPAAAPAVSPDEEAARLVPAVEELARRAGVPVTADTFQPRVASLALDAGAAAINDISGGADPEMLDLVAERGCGYVLMHIEGPPRVDREPQAHRDPVAHLKRWFQERIEAALEHGVAEEQIALDPGLDFDLSVDDDLEILRRLEELRELGRPSVRGRVAEGLPGGGAGRLVGGPRPGQPNASGRRPRRRRWPSPRVPRLCGFTTEARWMRCARPPRSARSPLIAGCPQQPQSPRRPPVASSAPSVAAAGWEGAIEPGRADGRLVAETLEAAEPAETVEPPRLPGARAGGRPARKRDRGALLPSARGARGRRLRQCDRHQRHGVRQVAVLQPPGSRPALP